MVHNGIGHILLLDFLWAHPNSLDWPIKSSGGPNNVCDIYIYIYKRIKMGFSLGGLLSAPSSFGEKEHALSFWTKSGCRREELINP